MELIRIRYDDKEKTVSIDDFVKASKAMLDDFGLHSNEGMIRSQIRQVLEGKKLNVVGTFLEKYIVRDHKEEGNE